MSKLKIAATSLFILVSFLALACGSDKAIDAYNEGVEFLENNQPDQAEEKFKLALEEDPDLGEAHVNLGLIYLNRNALDEAESEFRTGLSLIEKAEKTIVKDSEYEQVLSVAHQNVAAVSLAKAIEAEDDNDSAAAKKHWQTAMDELEKAKSIDPENAQAIELYDQIKDAY